jgi:hypothetical protein
VTSPSPSRGTRGRTGRHLNEPAERECCSSWKALALVLTALAFALAHAAALPGKLRLSKEAYLAVQTIYYPGFTLGAFSESAAIAPHPSRQIR